jgi:hypothetical protein
MQMFGEIDSFVPYGTDCSRPGKSAHSFMRLEESRERKLSDQVAHLPMTRLEGFLGYAPKTAEIERDLEAIRREPIIFNVLEKGVVWLCISCRREPHRRRHGCANRSTLPSFTSKGVAVRPADRHSDVRALWV